MKSLKEILNEKMNPLTPLEIPEMTEVQDIPEMTVDQNLQP
jgi:hypothetical protein